MGAAYRLTWAFASYLCDKFIFSLFDPLLPNGHFYLYTLGKSNFQFGVSSFFNFLITEAAVFNTNSVNSDKKPDSQGNQVLWNFLAGPENYV